MGDWQPLFYDVSIGVLFWTGMRIRLTMFVRWSGFLIWRTEMPVSNQRNLNFWLLLKSMQLNHKVGKERNQTLLLQPYCKIGPNSNTAQLERRLY